MNFDPGLKIGQELSHKEMYTLFKVGCSGGMRRSNATGTLVIISDKTTFYRDRWENGILYHTGFGQAGDQSLSGNNLTVYESKENGIEMHLFVVYEPMKFTYMGIVELAQEPYTEERPDEEGKMRQAWIFPLRLTFPEAEELMRPGKENLAVMDESTLLKNYRMKVDEYMPCQKEFTVYPENAYLAELAKRIAGGRCQLCGSEAPFRDEYGTPYLEIHHLIAREKGGPDTIGNIAVLCPNCHRRAQVLNDIFDALRLKGIAEENRRAFDRLTKEKTEN